jgi:hypothetical protein
MEQFEVAQQTRTWVKVYKDLEETMRKWEVSDFEVIAKYQGRQATQDCWNPEDRAVTLIWTRDTTVGPRDVQITMRKFQRTLDNLEAIQKAVEHLRLAEAREVNELVALMYRQIYPQAPVAPPSSAPSGHIPVYYRVLGVLPDAPMVVIEAAYKAQIRAHHPDLGGSTAKAQAINAAMEKIRNERKVTV